jgi:hypothetical protein
MRWRVGLVHHLALVDYRGYFGGGIGLLMMAALTMTGLEVRNAGAASNILAGVMNASAVAIFVFSGDLHWLQAPIPRSALRAAAGPRTGDQKRQREAAEVGRRRHWRHADGRAILEVIGVQSVGAPRGKRRASGASSRD